MKFLNPEVDRHYTTAQGQHDCEVVLPRLNWRSKLSRITPRVAEELMLQGSNLICKKTQVIEVVPLIVREDIPRPAAVGTRKGKLKKT